jgi:hypothetical protein
MEITDLSVPKLNSNDEKDDYSDDDENSPENIKARKSHAMMSNFCSKTDGSMLFDISLKQYAIDSGEKITNGTVQELCTVQPLLTRLDLTGCKEVSDVGLWAIARHCMQLETLILAECNLVTNIGLRSLSLRLMYLTELDMSYCLTLDDMALTVIASGCWKLQRINLRGIHIYMRMCTYEYIYE